MVVQRIAISPSVSLAAALCAAHVAAAIVLWLIPIPVMGKLALTMAVALSLIFFVARDAALHAPHSIVALEIRDGGEAALQTRRGDWHDCEVLGSSYVSPRLTIVNLRPRRRRGSRRLILLPDNVDPRDFRRLRVWLRWKAGESVQAVDY
jgi:toxin CptA